MPRHTASGPARNIALCLFLAVLSPRAARGQGQPASRDAVFSVTTDLVQTEVIVLDRQGRFVDNLGREQFELRVDGRPQPFTLFEPVPAGLAREGATAGAARDRVLPSAASAGGAARPPDPPGRVVLFFVDDLHLAPDSLGRARRVLTGFLDREMRQDDRVAITSASGQMGFLEQLTGNTAVLRAAVARLEYRARGALDPERPPMTAHQASLIDGRTDRDLLNFFIREVLRQSPLLPRDAAEDVVVGRAFRILEQAAAISADTLLALERLLRSLGELPGRKVVFFLSDGFELNVRGSDASRRLQRIADAAARSRAVLYTMGARGLATQPGFDAGSPAAFDPAGVVNRADGAALNASQEPLHRLAADSGGRALVNSNALAGAVPRALREVSRYYLVGWIPEHHEPPDNRFHRIEVSVRDRPEWTVRARRGFYDAPPPAEERAAPPSVRSRAERTDPAVSAADAALQSALGSTPPPSTLPTSLSLGYVDTAGHGTVLTAVTRLNAATPDFGGGNAKPAVVDVVNAVFNDQGQRVSSWKQTWTVAPPSTPAVEPGYRVTYRHPFRLSPGLYQVRVAARDRETGRIGSASEWIEIPHLQGGPLAMSSVILGERAAQASPETTGAAAAASPMEIHADAHFGRGTHLRFLTYLYNASRATATPDVAVSVQVFRDEKPVIAGPLTRVRTEGLADPSRIPYLAELNLEGLPGGAYLLVVTAVDRTTRATVSQRTQFELE